MRFFSRCCILLTAIAALNCGSTPPAPRTSSVEYVIDGGYAFFHDEREQLIITAVKGHEPAAGRAQMNLTVLRGTVAEAPQGLTPNDIPDSWQFTGWTLSVGDAAGKVELPPGPSTNLAPCADRVITGEAANDLGYLPDVDQHINRAVPVKLNPAAVESQVIIRSGRLAINRVGGCWQMTPLGLADVKGGGRPMVMGVKGFKHTDTVTGPLIVALEKIGAPSERRTLTIHPDAEGRIALGISRPLDIAPARLPVGAPDPHFNLFYDVVPVAADKAGLPVPHKVEDHTEPILAGDECVPFFAFFKRVFGTRTP